MADRPCYYQGRGRLKGSYTRIGDSDEPMTEYEIYSYEAYRRKYQDDIREVPRVTLMSLDQEELNRYVELLKRGKQRLATLDNESIYELMSIKRGEKVTLSATLLFSPYPQAYFPQLCITAIVIPGRTIGSLGDMAVGLMSTPSEYSLFPKRIERGITLILYSSTYFCGKSQVESVVIKISLIFGIFPLLSFGIIFRLCRNSKRGAKIYLFNAEIYLKRFYFLCGICSVEIDFQNL